MNLESKELYINMGDDIPQWNNLYPYEDQDDDVKQFWENEAMKLTNGVTINGVFIHPWLYWHINFWKMMLDVDNERIPGNSQLRDNEWMFAEFLKQAEEENKGIFMFGTRRFGKALLNSEILYLKDREKMIGNIVVGDRIYDDKGKLVEVTGVYPQGKVTAYRVVFEDGRNVICCGDHLWRVKYAGKWTVRPLKAIIASKFTDLSIPIGEVMQYETVRLPIPGSAYGAMVASYLAGYDSDVYFDKYACKRYLRSSPDQKKTFIDSFIQSFNNVVTGEDEMILSVIDMEVIRFVQRMFWSAGWFAKLDGNKLILSANKKELKIASISIYGKEQATCITVDNDSHLFLTTNYIVTHNTAIMSSFLARNATMTYNLTHNVIGSSKEDLMSLGEYLEFGLDNIHPFLRINRTGNNWDKEVILGVKTVGNIRDVHARIRITNIDSGKTTASLKTASGTPYTSIYDEVGKFPFLGAYLQGRPAHMMHGRMRGMMICSGCCCAGTIVYKANGEPCKIEDLKQEDGIVGFDSVTSRAISQNITWMKPPAEKECYRITTKRGRIIECSGDHPILTVINKRDGKRRYYGTDFKRADSLRVGRRICVSDGIDIWGNKKMFDPYLVGLLIGDGSYGFDKTPVISTSDDEVYDYIRSRYECDIEKQYKTKNGKNYREIRIKGICQELRKLGIYGQTKKDKTLPLNIHSYNREDVIMMIRGYFDADATFYSNKDKGFHRISIVSCSKYLLEELKGVLFKFGIHSTISYSPSRNPADRSVVLDSYICTITDKLSMIKYCDIIKTNVEYRKKKLESIIKFASDFNTKGSVRSKYIDGVIIEVVDKIEYIGVKPVYNLTASGTHTYIANGIVTHNTGGNVERSQDAQKVMNNPAEYGFIVMNYDLLNRRCLKPTWRISKTGCFVPAQMSHAYKKERTTLDKYLGVEKAPGLKKIKIEVSKFDDNSKIVKDRLNELVKSDRELYVQERMSFPLSVDDCFLNTNVNRFPVEDALKHKSRLLEEGRPGKTVDVYQTDGKKMGYHFSDKQLAPFPFKGGNIDAPVVIYEDPPEEGGVFDYTYAAGCLTPGEKVMTGNGLKSVEDVTDNDTLINKEGEEVRIIERMKFDKKDVNVYTVKLGNTFRTTTFTGEHPLYLSKHKKTGKHTDEHKFEFDFKKVESASVGDWTKVPNIYADEWDESIHMNGFDSSIDFWYILGFWVGNGWIDKGNYVTMAINESDTITFDRVFGIVSNMGCEYLRSFKRKGCNCIVFKLSGLTCWITSVFGKYSYGKRIPEWVKHLRKDLKTSFIQGYLDSDGCITRHTKGYWQMEFVSVNMDLMEAFQDMLLSLGIVGNVTRLRKGREAFVVDRYSYQRETYHLRIGNEGCWRFKDLVHEIYDGDNQKIDKVSGDRGLKRHRRDCFISDDFKYIYFAITDISVSKYTGPVYNFHCETNNYLCYHISTHNCDPYKADKAETESVGAFYIVKRYVKINDPFAYRIVAAVASRPPSSDDFCRTCEILQEAYGSRCLMENADRMYELYLSRRSKQYMLLEDGEKIAGKMVNAKAHQNNKIGLAPTPANQRVLFNTVLQYCWEDILVGYDDDGNEITQKGIYRIPDIELLDEIISFGPGVNTDRIIAFGHALLLAKYYDDMGFMPTSTTQKENEKKRERKRVEQAKGYILRRHNPYRIR